MVEKEGRGKSAVYTIIKEFETTHALSIYDEARNDFTLSKQEMGLMQYDFACLLGIIMTPMLVFRGTYEEFLRYVELPTTEKSINAIKQSFKKLVEEDYIILALDNSVEGEEKIVASLKNKKEKEMRVGIEMLKTCKEIAEKNGCMKGTTINLIKTWIGLKYLEEQHIQPFTTKMLMDTTGLSEKALYRCKKLLTQGDNQVFTIGVERYLNDDNVWFCAGSTSEMNAFYKE